MSRYKYLWKPAYPFRYTKMDETAVQKSLAEVTEVAALYESRFLPQGRVYLTDDEVEVKDDTETEEETENITKETEIETEKTTKEAEETKNITKETEEETEKTPKGMEKETVTGKRGWTVMLYKYDPITKNVYREGILESRNKRIHLKDVQEIQKSLKKDVEEVQKQIDCLHIKIQCVNQAISYSTPRYSYRDNLSLGIRPRSLCFY